MNLEDQLKQKYQQIKQLNDEIPAQLAEKIRLYAETQMIIGKLQAAATYDYGKAYADRKRAWGAALAQTQGTQAVKEGTAEIVAAEFREIEAKAESELVEWKATYGATGEIIQALKYQLQVLMQEYNGGKKP